MKDLSGWDSRDGAKPVQQIERQHDHLVALIALLIERDAAAASTQELSGLLQELHALIKQHFDDEEQYMLATEYPRLDTHRVIHRELLARLHDHVQRFERGQRRLGNQILSFLRFWLSAHITGQDPEVRASPELRRGPMSRQTGAGCRHWPPASVANAAKSPELISKR